MIDIIAGSISDAMVYLMQSLLHNGIYLFLSIFISVLITVYLDTEKMRKLFLRKPGMLIPGSVATGALTPLCACGTMAVIFALVGSALPWGPIMAFLVSSPLMSPDTFVLISGFLGFDFALALMVASVILGLLAGYVTWILEKKTGFFEDQFKTLNRVTSQPVNLHIAQMKACSCTDDKEYFSTVTVKPFGFPDVNQSAISVKPLWRNLPVTKKSWRYLITRLKLDKVLMQVYNTGIKKIIPLFALFVLIAYIVKTYVPMTWVMALFNGSHWYSVPLASLIGLPLYVSDATIVPLLQVLKEAGASNGAILAFMISGPGTSLGVIAGMMILLKRRALVLYFAYILFGAIILGYLAELIPFSV